MHSFHASVSVSATHHALRDMASWLCVEVSSRVTIHCKNLSYSLLSPADETLLASSPLPGAASGPCKNEKEGGKGKDVGGCQPKVFVSLFKAFADPIQIWSVFSMLGVVRGEIFDLPC